MTTAIYHVASINHWREILNEQFGVLARACFPGPIYINFTGTPDEAGYIKHMASVNSLWLEHIQHARFDEFEFPALRLVSEIANEDDNNILYFHSKSVTHPNSWPRLMWRLYMNAWCLYEWDMLESGLARSSQYNVAGTGWTNMHPTGAFPGTFWMAKADHVRQLMPLDEYCVAFNAMLTHAPHNNTPRHAAEFWINSRSNVVPLNFGLENTRFWDHSFWTANAPACEFAYKYGTP